MNIIPDEILCLESVQISRFTQSCDYTYNGEYLFTEKSYFPWSPFEEPKYWQNFYQFILTKVEANILANKFGGSVNEHPYSENPENECYLSFEDNDLAVKFCQSEEFDSLLKVTEKI